MHIFVSVIIGSIVAVLTRFVMFGREEGGWLMSISIGVLGSLMAGLVGRGLGLYEAGEPAGLLVAVGGAGALLLAYHVFLRVDVSR